METSNFFVFLKALYIIHNLEKLSRHVDTDRLEATGVPFPLCYSNKEVVNCYPLSFSFYQKHIFPHTIALIVPVFTEQKRYWQQHWYARRWIHRFSGPAWVSIQEQPLKYIHFSKEGDFLIKGFHEQSGQVFCFPVRTRLNRDGRFLLTFSIFYSIQNSLNLKKINLAIMQPD